MAEKIFINYRRANSIGTAGRLRDRLARSFGQQNLFMDVDDIPAGVDFIAELKSHVAKCRVFLVIIGPNWLDVKEETGERRLDSPDDFVTIEIAAALERDIRVIPVLVDGAHMPKADQLPEAIKSLGRRNAVEVRNTQFGRDSEALIARVRDALGKSPTSPAWWLKPTRAGVAAVAVMVLIGFAGYVRMQTSRPESQDVSGPAPPPKTSTPAAPTTRSVEPGNLLDQLKQMETSPVPATPSTQPTVVIDKPTFKDARLDFCYRNGTSCGQEAADAYCKYLLYKSVAAQDGFEKDPDIWNTKTLAGDQTNGRDGFKIIKCVRPPI